ncbi:hypothetical protein, partial [Staphylococcus aureus]|uniref:hypothetical protein n=1 Tax=Staphylococcus aureus TaxID=1280 RepID=UPI001CBDFD48
SIFKRIISLSRKKIVAPNFNISFQCHSFDGSVLISKEKVFFYRCPTPTCTFLYADFPPASMLGPRQLALSVEIGNPISLCWGPSPTCTLL